MTSVKRADLQRRLAQWDPSIRLLLLAGPDESASRELAAIAVRALADPADPLSLTDLAPEDLKADPGRLSDEAASVSMFGGARVIRVSGAGDNVAEAARLLLAAPVAGNPVILLAGDLPRTSTLRKLAEESPLALALVSWPMDAREMGAWLQAEARRLGLRLESGVAERLVATSGGDTGVLASELNKFALFRDSSPDSPQSLDRSHLAALGADNGEDDMNALVSALMAGDRRTVERQLRLLEGTSSVPANRAIARRLFQLAEARAAVDSGTPPAQAVKALRPPIFWKEADAFTAALRHWPMPRIRAALATVLAGESRIKTVNGPGEPVGWHAILELELANLGTGRESA